MLRSLSRRHNQRRRRRLMESLTSKLRTVVLGNLHSLLDAAVDLNSIAAVKQHVRDLEAALSRIQEQAAMAHGDVTGIKRRIAELNSKVAELDANIDLALGQKSDDLAERLQVRQNQMKKDLEARTAELATAEQTDAALSDAVRKLDARHREMVDRVHHLEDLDRAAKAK